MSEPEKPRPDAVPQPPAQAPRQPSAVTTEDVDTLPVTQTHKPLSPLVRALIVVAVVLINAVLLARFFFGAPPPAPKVLISLQHHRPGEPRRSTWEASAEGEVLLSGAAETVLAQAFKAQGLAPVEQLAHKNLRRLLSDDAIDPTTLAIKAATQAWLGLSGEALCVQVGGAAEQGAKEVRVELRVQATQIDEQRVLLREVAEGRAKALELRAACDDAEHQAATRLAMPLARRLASYIPSGVGLAGAAKSEHTP